VRFEVNDATENCAKTAPEVALELAPALMTLAATIEGAQTEVDVCS